MKRKSPYIVKSAAPRAHEPGKSVVPLQQRNWPRWYCPRCQTQNNLESDVLPNVVMVDWATCSSCHTRWNVLIRFESVTAKPKRRRSEDDIETDYDTGETFAEDEQV